MASEEEYKYDYTRYRVKGIDRKLLDGIRDSVLGDTTSFITKIYSAVKLVVLVALYFLYQKIEETEMLIEKQQYEQKRRRTAKEQLGNDDLD